MQRQRIKMSWLAGIGVAAFLCGGSAFAQSARFGSTIAGITAGQDDLDKVRALYGAGAPTKTSDVQSLCYHFEADQAYLSVSTFAGQSRVRSITITTFAAVPPGCQDARVPGQHLTGPSGVHLGDGMQTVLAALGQPADRGQIQIDHRTIEYVSYTLSRGTGTCQFEGGKLILAGLQLQADQATSIDADTASAIAAAQKAALAAVNFQRGDAAGFARARGDFTPDGWTAFLKPMEPFMDRNGAPTLTSTFVASRDAILVGEAQGVLHLRIPGTLTQQNQIGTTTYSPAALEVFAVRNRTPGSNPVSIQELKQIVCVGASTACR